MPLALPTQHEELFADLDSPVAVAERFELLKAALNNAPTTGPGGTFTPQLPALQAEAAMRETPVTQLTKALGNPEITKALGADVLASVQAQLNASPDLVKDLTLTSPLSTGYVAYDLEAPAKLIAPRPTPLRNRMPRRKGVGVAHRYKRITGHTGTGTGGVGNTFPGITDSTTTTFGSLSMLRGPKITYAGDEVSVPYLQFSLSDQVPWSNQFSAQGFQDMRQLSQTTLLHSSMLMEERMILGARGTASGFGGALGAVGTPTLTVRAAVAGETGNTANIATITIGVTAVTQFGETTATFSAANTGMSASTGNVVEVKIPAPVPGAQAYRVYVGTTGVAATSYLANTLTVLSAAGTVGVSVTGGTVSHLSSTVNTVGSVDINFTGTGTGGLPAVSTNVPPTVASDSSALAYDGILAVVTGANSGYTKVLGTTFGSNPGDEFQQAFGTMYDANKADPDQALFNGFDRKQLSDTIKLNSNTSSYRITINDPHSYQQGAVVTGLQNEITGKMVDFSVHPWLMQGVSPILSWTMPIPDTQITDCWSMFNVQDYMAVSWPVIQFAYEASTYWYGTMVCYAPTYQGSISGIVRK